MNRFKVIKEIKSIKAILPAIAVLITGKPRYIPKIEWSSKSWTHNIFRAYESIFGRRFGIRAEITSYSDGVNVIYQAHTFEASCALIEQYIRSAFKFKIVKVYIPVLALNTGYKMPSKQPYVFAIAFDATAHLEESTSTNPHTFSFTCTGSNRELVVATAQGGIGIPSSCTYNGTSATARTASTNAAGVVFARFFTLVAPSTGSNTVSVNSGGTSGSLGIGIITSSYTGVDQTTDVGATNTAQVVNPVSISITSTVANSMLVDFIADSVTADTGSAGAGQTINGTWNNVAAASTPFDMGSSRKLTTSVGSYSMSWTGVSVSAADMHVIEILPLASAGANANFLQFMPM